VLKSASLALAPPDTVCPEMRQRSGETKTVDRLIVFGIV
jgi:hypothetical protein